MIPVTLRANLSYLLRHPLQLALALLGIGIGVAIGLIGLVLYVKLAPMLWNVMGLMPE